MAARIYDATLRAGLSTYRLHVAIDDDPSAEEIDVWLDTIEPDPADARDATHFRRIVAAAEGLANADAELRAAVAAAREAGDTWELIGVALGTSRQAVYQRFGKSTTRTPIGPDYEALAHSYAAEPVRADEVRSVDVGGAEGVESTGDPTGG